jgi:hypothetical protein
MSRPVIVYAPAPKRARKIRPNRTGPAVVGKALPVIVGRPAPNAFEQDRAEAQRAYEAGQRIWARLVEAAASSPAEGARKNRERLR